jgi:hypothetical protein
MRKNEMSPTPLASSAAWHKANPEGDVLENVLNTLAGLIPGGAENDTCRVGNSADPVAENPDEGTDTVRASADRAANDGARRRVAWAA